MYYFSINWEVIVAHLTIKKNCKIQHTIYLKHNHIFTYNKDKLASEIYMKIIRHNMNTSIFIWLIHSLSLIQVVFQSHWTSELYWGRKQFHGCQTPDCLFHIFIPKAIDKRVQHRNHDSKKHSGYFDEEPWAFGVGYTIKEQDSPMENGDGSQMGGTGGEGFSESTSWRHLDDCDNYESIGGEDNQEATHLIECRNDETRQLTEMGVRTGSRDDGRILTAKVMYDIELQKDSSKREHVIVKEHIIPHV